MKLVIRVLSILTLVSLMEGVLATLLLPTIIKKMTSELNSHNNAKCKRPHYRPYDGYCNNVENPTWGTANIPYNRMFQNYSYEDGLSAMPILPNARKISLQGFFHLNKTEDNRWTTNTQVWGQMIAHDMALTAGVQQSGDPEVPCSCVHGKMVNSESKSKNENCAPILIPNDDPYNGPIGKDCMIFTRTISTYDKKSHKPAEQINRVNSYLDASILYGGNEKEAKQLRSFKCGMLLCQTRHGRMYPPHSTNENLCHKYQRSKDDRLCCQTGDVRANQSPYSAYFHIMLLRLHNKIASEFCTINEHWNDEKIYQESRRIVIACIQHITYYEMGPFVLGRINMINKGLIPLTPSIFDSVYDKTVDVTCLNEHSTAAFRSFHSGIRGFMQLMTQDRKEFGTVKLGDHYDDASIYLQKDVELGITTGFATQYQWKIDRFHDLGVTQELFKYEDAIGQDLFATDLSRGRDHGLASYAVAVKQCGLGNPKSFDDFLLHMSIENVELLKRLYDSYEKVELFSGGLLESISIYGLTGPTFICIMLEQFYRTKRGDYYWYENKEQEYPFTKEQLKSIKKGASISSLICNTIDGMERMQKLGFEGVNIYNPLMNCEDIPFIDLTLWKEEI